MRVPCPTPVLAACCAAALLATPRPGAAQGTFADSSERASVVAGARPAVNPLHAAIAALLESERVQVRELQARLAQERDPAAATALERRIEAVKTETEVAILRAQAGNARTRGRQELAAHLEAAIAEMLARSDGRPPATAPGAAGVNVPAATRATAPGAAGVNVPAAARATAPAAARASDPHPGR